MKFNHNVVKLLVAAGALTAAGGELLTLSSAITRLTRMT